MRHIVLFFLLSGICFAGNSTVGNITVGSASVAPVAMENFVRKEIDIIVLAGQSNARGTMSNAPTLLTPQQTNQIHRFWYNDESGLSGSNSNVRVLNLTPTNWHWGVEISALDRIYTNYGSQMCVVKATKGSTGLYDTNRWQKGGTCYLSLSNLLTVAISQLQSEGYTVNIKCFWWIQGENDSVNGITNATNYTSNFNTFWSDICADTGMATNTMIWLTPLPAWYGAPYAAEVRICQTNLALSPTIDLINTSGTAHGEPSHYNEASYILLGERFADAYMDRFQKTPYPRALTNGTFFAIY